MAQIISGAILALGSVYDIKNKRIPVLYVNCCLALALIIAIVSKEETIVNLLISLVPGTVFYLVAVLFEGTVGKGDGLMIAIMGLLLGIKNICLVLLISFGLSAVVSIVLIGFFRKGRNTTLPFVPFLLAGQLVLTIIEKI